MLLPPIAVLFATRALADTVTLPVAVSPPASASTPVPGDFQSFSIEFAFFPDFAGNYSHPNHLTNTLLANLRNFTGAEQIIRIGGNTQDHVVYIASQKQGIMNTWDYTYNLDQPKNSTIGPAFWESLNVLQDTKYIFGLNFYKNDSDFLANLQYEVNQTLLRLPSDRLHLFELGNENDYGANSGFRPRNWTQFDYVDEWIFRTRHVQTPQRSLRFFAPSFCCFNITAPTFFSPWTVWNESYRYDRDGWIEEVSQHGYISSTSRNPTLQADSLRNIDEPYLCRPSRPATRRAEHLPPAARTTVHNRRDEQRLGTGLARGIRRVWLCVVAGRLLSVHRVAGATPYHRGSVILTWYTDCLEHHENPPPPRHATDTASWLPIPVNGTGPLVKPPYYGNIFVAKFLGWSGPQISNIDLGSDYYSAYAAYEGGKLARLAILNLHQYDPGMNGTQRPQTSFVLPNLPDFTAAKVEVLTAPGASSNSSITVAGLSYDYQLGQGRGVQVAATGTTIESRNGSFTVDVAASEAVIVSFLQ
ncbi:Glycoside hydrolase family 79 protein [Rasamsonia emersonii CBS 393.64]|uniref:Glycoside hydrolase family 79 protein n=1 Tax=Rasamsonia emersonii (strain ATCC 16479 / CBS 393.64 / IMI 116815) TaxID=1408163 RepID=A0A0F4YEC1_RASE3|nr:Glycoside hydrolase family 79 protein [Rasamsonia emersonii CBS 393.64]KKA16534.1 Glycoside hydrolase family 79 protein [Rasamsonia emersonii CBS 393.64]